MKTFSLALALFATLANSNKLPTEGTIDSAKAINLAQTEVETDSRAYANVYARDSRYNPYARAA